MCSVKYLFRAHKTKRKDIQKVFYGHRLTQINADENHKLLIILFLVVIIYVVSYLTEHLWALFMFNINRLE